MKSLLPRAGEALRLSIIASLIAVHGCRRGDDAPLVYVSNEDSGDVSVIDTATDSEVARIAVGKRPRGLKLSRDGSVLYLALSGSPKSPPGVDESKLPPPDRAADGIAVI